MKTNNNNAKSAIASALTKKDPNPKPKPTPEQLKSLEIRKTKSDIDSEADNIFGGSDSDDKRFYKRTKYREKNVPHDRWYN